MILTRSTRLSQPQGPVEVAPEFGDAAAFVPGAVNPTFATRTTRVLTTEGRAERGSAATGGVSPSTAAYIAFSGSARTFLGNKPHWAFIAGNIANTSSNSWLFGAGQPSANAGILLTYLSSTARLEFATRVGGVWYASSAAVTLSANRDFEAGYSIDADGTLRLYWDRREVLVKTGVGATTPTPNLPPAAGMAYASQANNNLYGNSTSIAFAAVGQSEYADRIGARLAANPWQLFRPVQRRVYFDMGAGGGGTTHTVTADPVDQGSTTTRPGLTQTHVTTASAVAQGATVSRPAITQTHVVTARAVEQGSTVNAPAVEVGSITVVTARPVVQSSTVNAPSIVQTHIVTARPSVQGATVTRPGLNQTHTVTARAVTQSSVVNAPSVDVGSTPATFVTARPVAQGSTVNAPGIRQTHVTSAREVVQRSTINAPGLVQAHVVAARPVVQASTVRVAGIAPPFVRSMYLAAVPAGEYSATVPAGIFKASI